MSGFTSKLLTAVITAGPATANYTPPTFGPNKQNTITITGRQISAGIDLALLSWQEAQISITGMSLSDMNEVQSLNQQFFYQNDTQISLLAGDANSMSLVFQGYISTAFIDGTQAPNVALVIQATQSFDLTPVPPSSYSGPVDVAVIIQQLAQLGGYQFENNGVSAILNNPYLQGSYLHQIKDCAAHAGINFTLDKGGDLGTVAIWPANGMRGSQVPLISPDTGLVGYPTYTNNGLNFRCLYNPKLVLGAMVQIQSSLKPACGNWYIYSMSHTLDTQTADGNWWTDVATSNQPNGFLGQ